MALAANLEFIAKKPSERPSNMKHNQRHLPPMRNLPALSPRGLNKILKKLPRKRVSLLPPPNPSKPLRKGRNKNLHRGSTPCVSRTRSHALLPGADGVDIVVADANSTGPQGAGMRHARAISNP